jgi:predicted dehydrogenase
MINVGVIGLGFMGVTHIKAYRQIEGVRLAAICDAIKLPVDGVLAGVSGNVADPDAVRLDMTQIKAYRNYEELLANPEIHLVDICVPTPDHPKVAIAALKSEKHVICEKPLARTSAIARGILNAAASAKGHFMPAMCMRFWPGWSWLKPAIQDNRYGRVLAARFRRVSGPPGWSRANYFKGADSGGALLDLHIHDTDFVQFLFGVPEAVVSHGLSHFSGAFDHVITEYKVRGGAAVYAEGSWLMSDGFGFNMAYTVNFETATADYDLARGADALKLYEEGKPPRVVPPENGDGYVGELSHLIDSIRNRQRPTVVTGLDGLSAVAICEAEERSIRNGQWERVMVPA